MELVEAEETFILNAAEIQNLDDATVSGALDRFVGPSPNTLTASAAADKVSLLIGLELYRGVVEDEQIEVTDAHRAAAAGQLESELAAQNMSRDNIPAVLFEVHEERLALEQAISESAPEVTEPTEAELQQAYEQQVDNFTQLCLQGVIVDPADADEATERLEAGEDQVAVAEALGGIGPEPEPECVAVADLAAVAPEATEAEVGSVIGPLQSQEGAWVLRVEEIDVPALDDIRGQLVAQFQQAAEQAGQAYISDLMMAASDRAVVEVDPRFGTWNPATGMVDPPVDPTAAPPEPAFDLVATEP